MVWSYNLEHQKPEPEHVAYGLFLVDRAALPSVTHVDVQLRRSFVPAASTARKHKAPFRLVVYSTTVPART